MDLRALVDARLGAYPGEHLLFAQYARLPAEDMSFETYRDAVVAELSRRLNATLKDLRIPPDPSLLTLKSWQYGLPGAAGDDAAARGFADGVYLRLQQHRGDHLTSERWRLYLGALDRPARWLAAGAALEHEGATVEANACFAAARWLAPACEPEIAAILRARPASLPRRLLDQPAADFPALPFRERHWRAWDMKNYGRLDLPSLLRWECDPNFSVRARIYRSLGQRPHPASIQALQEATGDPHWFARAQAIRSLGWCADPTFVARLCELAVDDPHPAARRSAARAVQRIVGYWTFYGEWNTIAASREHTLAAARQLAAAGLPAFAYDIAVRFGWADRCPETEALADALEPDALRGYDGDYHDWFAEAAAAEAADTPELTDVAALAGAADPGPTGFETRRQLRRRGLGAPAQRRLHPSEWT